MSVTVDDDGRRWVQSEVEINASPEAVWDAIATGEGISRWFVPTRFERNDEGVPTSVVSDFGEHGEARANIVSWDAPRRFTAENPSDAWGPGSPPVATEWSMETRDGGSCVVRVVHSLFASTDDWDKQLEDTGPGWAQFFGTLKTVLEG